MSSLFFLSCICEREVMLYTLKTLVCYIVCNYKHTRSNTRTIYLFYCSTFNPVIFILCFCAYSTFVWSKSLDFWHRRRNGRHFFRPSDCSFHLSTHCYRSVQDLNTVVAVFSLTHQPDMLLGQEPQRSIFSS